MDPLFEAFEGIAQVVFRRPEVFAYVKEEQTPDPGAQPVLTHEALELLKEAMKPVPLVLEQMSQMEIEEQNGIPGTHTDIPTEMKEAMKPM